jgi:anti-sigma B factor antagonist
VPGEPDGITVVRMPAELDQPNAAQIRVLLTQPLADGVTVLIADMSATASCTLEGLHALLQARAAAAAAGAQLRLAAAGPAVRRLMERTGADRILQLYPSLDAARSMTA